MGIGMGNAETVRGGGGGGGIHINFLEQFYYCVLSDCTLESLQVLQKKVVTTIKLFFRTQQNLIGLVLDI